MTALAIVLKLCQKHILDVSDKEQQGSKEIRKKLLKDFFEFSLPLIEQHYVNMNFAEITMSLRALQVLDLVTTDFVTKIFSQLMSEVDSASTIEIYQILDLTLELTLFNLNSPEHDPQYVTLVNELLRYLSERITSQKQEGI